MLEPDRLTRTVQPAADSREEEQLERALRPKVLDEYIGQEKIRNQLSIFIEATRNRSEAMDHVLLFGPPGLGKTTLSHIIARELGVNLRQTSGPVLEKPGDLAAMLTNLERNDVLRKDEATCVARCERARLERRNCVEDQCLCVLERNHSGPRCSNSSRSHAANGGPRSGRSSASSTFARRKSSFLPTS